MSLSTAFRLNTYVRVDDKLCGFGTSWECTSGFDFGSSAQQLCENAHATLTPLLLNIMATDVTFEGYYAVCLVAATALPYRFAGVSQPGLRTGSAMPANSCLVITLQTTEVTAVRHGRAFVSGCPKEELTNGTFDAAFIATPCKALADALGQSIIGGGQEFQPRIVQRIIAGAPVGPNLLPVDATRVTQVPYTQRRRTTKQLSCVA